MSKGNTFENDYLLLIFNNTNIANLGDATGVRGSSTAGSLYVALHTADPGEAGDQTTSEISYTGYARVAVARSAGGWTVSSNSVSNTAAVTFGQMTAGTGGTVTHVSVGISSAGAGKVLYKAPLGTSFQGAFTGATSDTLTIPGHTLAVDDRVAFYPVAGGTLPTGITEGTLYWVKTSATDTITISTTQGGATLDVTGVGDGIVFKATTLAVSVNITPEFAAGQIVITED